MKKKLLLKNGRVIDPSRNLDETLDILIDDEGKIARIGANLKSAGTETLDLSRLVVAPGFIDMHVHLREPGKEEAETIQTGTRAAIAGGFTAVACMPNTNPVNDNAGITEFILQKARKEAAIPVYPIAAISKKQAGEELTEMGELKEAGAVAVSDDGKPVANSRLMRYALEYAKMFNLPVIDHCEDPNLFKGGVMHEGFYSTKLGLRGIPSAAEEIMVSRNVLLSGLTEARVHLAHLSTAGSMELVRRAKEQRLQVTAEVTPHHFTLTDEAVCSYDTNTKMNPPLRTAEDVEAVLAAIEDGTVDVIASDHAPHHSDTKMVEYDIASFGIVGLETSVSLGLDRLVNTNRISLGRFVELYSLNPGRILGIRRGVKEGSPATLTVFHPSKKITVQPSKFQSKSRNTPFDGWSLRGAPMATISYGELVWKHPSL
jgi:dihydroorotase